MSGDGELELDFERFEYEEVSTFGGGTYYVKVGCHHRNVEDVHLLTGSVVARLCMDCNRRLPALGPIEW